MDGSAAFVRRTLPTRCPHHPDTHHTMANPQSLSDHGATTSAWNENAELCEGVSAPAMRHTMALPPSSAKPDLVGLTASNLKLQRRLEVTGMMRSRQCTRPSLSHAQEGSSRPHPSSRFLEPQDVHQRSPLGWRGQDLVLPHL